MRLWRTFPILLALLLGASASSLDAQIGPIIDWITALSGPGVARAGLQFTTPLTGRDGALELSVAGMYGGEVKDGSGPDGDTGLSLLSFQGTLDVRLFRISPTIDVLAIGGIAGHSFTGDAFDSFGAFSFPLNAALRFGTPGATEFRVGGGWNIFRFPDSAFEGLDVGVDAGSWEAALGFQAVLIVDF